MGEEEKRISKFAKERDAAFIAAVVDDDWDAVKRYAKKYDVPIPKSPKVMKAGIYKAVQYCTDISEEVKGIAMQKCLELGFNPFIEAIKPIMKGGSE